MNRLFMVRVLMLFSLAILYPGFSSADVNDSLWAAIINGDIESAKRFLQDGADVNKIYDDESTPLLEAVDKSSGSSDMVNLLLQYGADPKLKPKSVSALSSALKINNDAIIRLLRHYAEDDEECYGLALFFRDRKEDFSALEYADKALKLNPFKYEAWELKGSVYFSQKKIKNAEDAYHNAFEASLENLKTGKSADGYNSAVWYALLAADFNEALRLGKEGLSLFPESGLIAMNTGHALLFLGNKKEAAAFYKKSYNDLKQNDKYGAQAAEVFSDDFAHLKVRYPDKKTLIGWAEKRLFEPFDFTYDEIPFGEAVLNLLEGADVKKDETAIIGVLDPVLKKHFGEGLYAVDLKTQLSPTVVEKYSVSYDGWDTIEHIDFFTAGAGQDGQKTLFLVSKFFKEQRGKIDALFGTVQETASKELNMQPVVHNTQIMSRFGPIPLPVKIAVWKSTDTTVILDVVNASSSSLQSRILVVSKKGWEKYLNSLRVYKTQ